MGSPLGPTFANFYMANLEKTVLTKDNSFNPTFYVRYVDDTLCVFKNHEDINRFIEALQQSSCLNFTYELPTTDHFNFLDVKFKVVAGKVQTGIYVKDTDKGLYFDFTSHVPLDYKVSLIKTLVFRAFKLCSTWELFHKEIERITTNLVNNNFPQSLIEKHVNRLTDKLIKNDAPRKDTDNDRTITFYSRCLDAGSFKSDSIFLKETFKKHVIPTNSNDKVEVRLFFKPSKLSSRFSLRERRPDNANHGLVYQFTCNEEGCNASYIGYTMNRLDVRAKQHKYSGSKIHEHYKIDHHAKPENITDQFSILYRNNHIRYNKIAEAILIKDRRPDINVRFNEMATGLKIYK